MLRSACPKECWLEGVWDISSAVLVLREVLALRSASSKTCWLEGVRF